MRILYFDIDSLRPDHLGCYGYARPTSPCIDGVARQGMRFNRYYTSDSPCQPSRSALTTGRFGIHNGIVTHGQAFNNLRISQTGYSGPHPDEQLLQLRLRQAGLETWCFSTFALRHCATWFSLGWSGYFTPNLKCGQEAAEEVNAAALPWLEQHARDENWFCYINFWDPHRTYRTADVSYRDRFAGHPAPQSWPDDAVLAEHMKLDGGPFTACRQFVPGGEAPPPLMPRQVGCRADFEQMITGYDCEIAYTDDQVARVLKVLEKQGVLDDAIIIISADHGDNFGEHGIYSDHVCADEAIHHVPLIVRWPGVTTPGSVCDSMLYNVDLLPTLCEMVGLDAPAHCDGRSFAGHLHGSPAFDRDHLVWGHGLYTLQRAVRTRQHLMIRTYDNYGYTQFDPVALYDMDADPYQTHNLADAQPQQLAAMDHLLCQWEHDQRTKLWSGDDPLMSVLHHRQRTEARFAR